MRIPRIYTEKNLGEHFQKYKGETIELSDEASHHILKVLRMDVGRELILFDKQHNKEALCEYRAIITAKTKRTASVTLTERHTNNTESPLSTHLAIGISRGDRFDWVLQKATELGITHITPLFTERTEVKLQKERLEKKYQSWQKIIISACEQSGRAMLPTLHPYQRFDDFIKQHHDEIKLVLHHRSSHKISQEKITSCTLLIGPEGGLSDSEIEQALANNYHALTLGPRVLRTETAPLAALSILQYTFGDM